MKKLSFYLLIAFILGVSAASESSASTMADYTSVPPFLTVGGVDPNLLLLIDNSASMYDLAYVDDQGYCYDDTYDSSSTYAGYFDPGASYAYNLAGGQFEAKTAAQATAICSSATYTNSDVCITMDATPSVTAFCAKGNFLNWATASKLDIEKEILTGGKYDSANTRLVMESRGCLDRRFVKKVAVVDSSASTFYLTLAARPPADTEKVDASDDTTRIDIFNVTDTGFSNTACQSAIDEFQEESPNQGQIKQDIRECMSYNSSNKELANSMSAYNHAVHNCWYKDRHGVWPEGAGPTQSVMNDCTKIYEAGVDPAEITPDDWGYVCYGVYDPAPGLREGYAGRCWDPTLVTYDASGDIDTPGWISNECIEAAVQDYCGILHIPEVIDPSDQAGETGEFWNIPAMLVDSGVVGQLDEPLVVLKGYIAQSTAPTGLLQQYADDLRIGAMVFNDNGSAAECASNANVTCPGGDNRDGGKIISTIDQGGTHTTDLVSAINDIKATSWTPIAEAMYNAIGYYTQNSGLRLHADDFSTATDPVTAWCQANNILIITDGASTTDLNTTVSTFAAIAGQNDGDGADVAECGSLSGSTLLDDLTYYAKNGTDIYPAATAQIDGEDKQKIATYIVSAGTLRVTGTDECSPDVILQNAAQNGGTTLYEAENPSDLEEKLRVAFYTIRGGAASGTAAAVVSASHRGEGALYQAMFYETYEDIHGTEIKWMGKLHSLFVDEFGNMREDSNGNHILDMTSDKIIELFFDEVGGRTRATIDTDSDGDGQADGSPVTVELSAIHYLWEAGKVLAERDDSVRTIYTWIDTDGEADVDAGEWMEFTDIHADELRPYVAKSTIAEAETLINYIRGEEQTGYRSRTIEVDGTDQVWKLGDIVYSTPTAVSKPQENYEFLYGDISYYTFKTQYKNRRTVVYVGGNDGMLHAFNGGFYDKKDLEFEDGTSIPSYSSAVPSLGEELWAYVPYNLLPHLRWLGDENYSHVYYVDLKPKIVDAKIFSDDAAHPGGWGTVLVCGMRFGGGTISLTDDFGSGNETRAFRSAYFALDITNPEVAPTLLWELTDADLGFTTSYPSIVYVDSSTWAIAFGSGPTDYSGTSSQSAKTYIVNLKTGALIGSALATSSGNASMGDPISVDMDISSSQCHSGACSYGPDIAYIGNSEGKLYRIKSITDSSEGTASVFVDLEDANKPITGAPSASLDDDGRLWLYFGTGRLYSDSDETTTNTQALVGVKEPIDFDDADGDDNTLEFSYAMVVPATILDVSDYTVFQGGFIDTNGDFTTYETTFNALVEDITQYLAEAAPRDYDGWIQDLTGGERCLTKPTVMGGIVTFTTFEPDDAVCSYEGDSFLYALYYKTGTAYLKSIIGYGDDTMTVIVDGEAQDKNEINKHISLGHGMSSSASLHVGTAQGGKAFVQSSTGEILEIDEQNLPGAYKSRPVHWIQQGN